MSFKWFKWFAPDFSESHFLAGRRSPGYLLNPAFMPVLYCHYYDFNPTTTREDIRRLGIILASAGLLSAFLEGGDPLVAAGLALVGIGALVIGNLELNP